MKIIRKNIDNLPFCLHDMYVKDIKTENDALILSFPDGIESTSAPHERVYADIRFNKVDFDFSFAYVFDTAKNNGCFKGQKLCLHDYIEQFHNVSLEIVDENYGYNSSKFSCYLHIDNGMRECMLEIYHLGDMEYIIRK